MLQIKAAKPNEIADTRSVWAGALSAIMAANKPIKLNSTRSIKILFSGNIHLDIRCDRSNTPAIHLKLRKVGNAFIINSKIMYGPNK